MKTKSFNQNYLPLIPTFILAVFALLQVTNIYAQDDGKIAKQKAFEQFFGDAAKLDPAMVQKVKADIPGKRHYVDKNGDGKPEEVWFIDIDPRHNERNRPMLVKVVDEDGDLQTGKEPDRYGDLWIADWNADGLVNAVIKYDDLDGDKDVDRMEWYTYGKKNRNVDKDGLRVLLVMDDGDDNLLDYDIDYVYYQQPCQDHSHLGGNESFTAFYLDTELNKWIPYFENPFLFYDSDNDGVTEEVIRIEGKNELVKYLRWSFDADPVPGKQRDFDVSLSACAAGWTDEKDRESDFNMHLGKEQTETFTVRGIPTGTVLRRSSARDYLQTVTWERIIMAWDENDLNIAWNIPDDTIERWEGVIAAPSTDKGFHMARVGNPHCGPFNKRYELVLKPTGPNEFYFNPADHRIHIKNSDRTWIKADYNYDLKTDMNYLWVDTNHDGVMDRVNIDVDGDSIMDDSYDIDVSGIKPIKWIFRDVNESFAPILKTEPSNKYLLVKALGSAIETIKKGYSEDPVWNMIENSMRNVNISNGIARRLVNSDETLMYYLTLVQDRQIAKLKKLFSGSKSFWNDFNAARKYGNTVAMKQVVNKSFKLHDPKEDYTTWTASLRKMPEKTHVAWNNQWLPPNWGWESDKAAFRFYYGHFDLFGKHEGQDTLIMPKIAEGKSYHLDQNSWGMDILHVGKTGGSGGVTLYVNGVAYPVRNETGKGNPVFKSRLVKESRDTVTVEFIATGVGPEKAPYTVKLRPSGLAGRFDSPVEVLVEGGTPGEKVELGIGLVRLGEETFYSDKASGIIGSWGFQDPAIGWIGMGIVTPPERFIHYDDQSAEHLVVLRCEPGVPLVYYIRADWLRGHRFSCCPSAQDWFDTLKKTARKLNEL